MLQALSNTAWACSKLGVYSKELLDAIAQEASKKLRDFNAQNIANLVSSVNVNAVRSYLLVRICSYIFVHVMRGEGLLMRHLSGGQGRLYKLQLWL